MIDINKIIKERGYVDCYKTNPELTFYIAYIIMPRLNYIDFLIDKKTGEEYFKEKGYKNISVSVEKELMRIRKWGLYYKTNIDFKTMRIKGIQEFIN